MINIKIITIGTLGEKYLMDMQKEYLKRLSKYSSIEIIELKEISFSKTISLKEKQNIKKEETKKIIDKIKKYKKPYVFVLDELGKSFKSTELAKELSDLYDLSYSEYVFVIGGSLGLDNNLIKDLGPTLSFSKLTFPHQLIRCFLLEQLFRTFKINSNEKYHN